MTEKVFRAMHKVACSLHKNATNPFNVVGNSLEKGKPFYNEVAERVKSVALPDEDPMRTASSLVHMIQRGAYNSVNPAENVDDALASIDPEAYADLTEGDSAYKKSLLHRLSQGIWAHKHTPGHGLPSGGGFSNLSTRIGQSINRGIDDVARGVTTTGRTLKELPGTYLDMYAVTPAKKLMSLFRKKPVQVAQKH